MEVNTIYYGDCKKILTETFTNVDKYFIEAGHDLPKKFADLIYIDPPFFSDKKYEVIWGDGCEIRCFDDAKWYDGEKRRKSIHVYLDFIRECVEKCYQVLKETGTFYFHCDWHASHYIKIMLDEIFGNDKFRDEIIWSFSKVAGTTKKLLKWHETIFRYSKSDNYVFNIDELREPYSESILKNLKKDDKGYYYTRGLGNDQSIKRNKKTYLHPKGKLPGDVWDLGTYSPPKNERLGYPTQKPEKLLERIIRLSSNPGEIILDPMCGCGTTLSVAYKLKRQYIGIDISYTACRLIQDRLEKLGALPKPIGKAKTIDDFKNLKPFDFQNIIFKIIKGKNNPKKTKDYGIDGWTAEGIPVQVKQQRVHRQHIDEFETALKRHYSQLGNNGKEKIGLIIGYGFSDSAWDEIKRAKYDENLIINCSTLTKLTDEWNKYFTFGGI